MQYTIHGELAQVANLMLNKAETCWASKGSIVAMDPATNDAVDFCFLAK